MEHMAFFGFAIHDFHVILGFYLFTSGFYCFLLSSFSTTVFKWCLTTFVFRFLTKLLTVDLPRLFVRPKKIVLDFQKGKAVGPVANDLKSGEIQEEKNKDFVGELSVTLVDARKLSYVFYGKSCFSFELRDDIF